ncbi:MAG: GNAT family N-acetyltransferase [Deltaproteobacteria bacterium]|nr:GNAT family N-acetyltransferase [Deltaproteobacteria bacterium]
MIKPQTLKTERLRLRKVKLSDAEAIFRQYAQDPEVTRYVSWRAHQSLDETREYVRMCLLAWDVGKAYHWAIERLEDKQVIGMIITRVNGEKWELGFVLARGHWGQGYMTEAVKGLIAWAFKQKDVYRVWAVCDVDNAASARVMEKSGMQREGVLRRWSVHPNISPEPRDSYCYAIVK